MESADWFYVRGDNEAGPFSGEELQELLARGEIGPRTLVRRKTWMEWREARTLDPRSAKPSLADSRNAASSPPVATDGRLVELAARSRPRARRQLVAAIVASLLIVVATVAWSLSTRFTAGTPASQEAAAPRDLGGDHEIVSQAPGKRPVVSHIKQEREREDPRWRLEAIAFDAPQQQPVILVSAPDNPPDKDPVVAPVASPPSLSPKDAGRTVGNDTFSPSELFKHISPSVVWVNNYDNNGKLAAFGSGFILSRDGDVATNLHVIKGAHKVAVRLHDGTTIPVRSVVGMDRDYDLAVLAVEGSGFDCIQLSTGPAEVGTRVYAIGNPEGLANSLSEGIVSGWREIDGVRFIQTTAAISSGSSGGPLLAADGTVVGITSASLRGGQSLNLAIPAQALRSLLDKGRQPVSLAQVNAAIGIEQHQQTTIEDDPNALNAIWKAIRERKLGEALKALEQIPDTRRGFGFWMATGHVHFALDNFEMAQAAFGKAVVIDRSSTEALLRLALAFRFCDTHESWDTAIALCKRVLKLDPANAQAHCILGITVMPRDQEIGFLKTASALDPTSFSAQYNLGLALCDKGGEEAIRALNAALELEKAADYLFVPSSKRLSLVSTTGSIQVAIKLALGEAYRESGKYELAVQTFQEVLAIEPDNPVATWGLCFTYRRWRNFKDPDALYWEKRAEARNLDVLRGMFVGSNCPKIVTIGKQSRPPTVAQPQGRAIGKGRIAESWIHKAVRDKDTQVVRAMVQLNPRCLLEMEEGPSGFTPLHAACERGFQEMAELLLTLGADVNVRARNGETPLITAVAKRGKENRELALFFIAKGADVKASSHDGWTALHYTANENMPALAQTLIDKGAAVDAKTVEGKTPLDIAFKQDSREVVQVLLKNGAEIRGRREDGKTQR